MDSRKLLILSIDRMVSELIDAVRIEQAIHESWDNKVSEAVRLFVDDYIIKSKKTHLLLANTQIQTHDVACQTCEPFTQHGIDVPFNVINGYSVNRHLIRSMALRSRSTPYTDKSLPLNSNDKENEPIGNRQSSISRHSSSACSCSCFAGSKSSYCSASVTPQSTRHVQCSCFTHSKMHRSSRLTNVEQSNTNKSTHMCSCFCTSHSNGTSRPPSRTIQKQTQSSSSGVYSSHVDRPYSFFDSD